jgi:Spy/CpxP family protein refolding chaperone
MTLVTQILLLAALALGGGASEKAPKEEAGHDHKSDKTDKSDKAGKRDRADKEQLRDQIFDQMRAERMWKLTDALKLNEASAAKVFPLLSKYDDQERSLGHERGQTYRELREATEAPAPDAARIDGLVNRLLALRARRQALETEKITALRKMLTPVQMAKLMMLTPRLEEGFRQRIRDAMNDGHDDQPANARGASRTTPTRPIR